MPFLPLVQDLALIEPYLPPRTPYMATFHCVLRSGLGGSPVSLSLFQHYSHRQTPCRLVLTTPSLPRMLPGPALKPLTAPKRPGFVVSTRAAEPPVSCRVVSAVASLASIAGFSSRLAPWSRRLGYVYDQATLNSGDGLLQFISH